VFAANTKAPDTAKMVILRMRGYPHPKCFPEFFYTDHSRGALWGHRPHRDSQVINIKASGADIFFDVAMAKFAPSDQENRGAGCKPVHLVNTTGNSVGAVLRRQSQVYRPSRPPTFLRFRGVKTAAMAAASKLPAKVVQERLGHPAITMTMDVYGHWCRPVDDGAEPATAAAHLFASEIP
jgi:integrase